MRRRTAPGGPVPRLVPRLLVGLLVTLLCGCASLPEAGSVRHESDAQRDVPVGAPYFAPPGPPEGASPTAVVTGFLTAMQANPLSTRVAREYLSERARTAWRPSEGTLVYEASNVVSSGGAVSLRLSDVRRLDSRGGWRGGSPGQTESIDVDVVPEGGEWRIDNPVDALMVPTSFFDRGFERLDLYFFDQTGRFLLPDPVFVPRGEQTATTLVEGLLQGPGPALEEVSRSAFPRGAELELSVVVTESGVADVPLTRELERASPAQLARLMDQLTWTLSQVPGIDRVRLSVGGTPVPLPGGGIEAVVTRDPALDAAGSSDPALLGVREGRLVEVYGDAALVPDVGGDADFTPRSIAVGASPPRVAAVSADGTEVVERSLPGAEAAARPLFRGNDLARPSYDLTGDLWLLDRTLVGARVLLARAGEVRELDVEGVSGEAVRAMSVSADGTRLAVAYAAEGPPQVRVVDVLRDEAGEVSGTGGSRLLTVSRLDAATVDVGWRDPATLAVLTRPTEETSRVDLVSADGAPLGGEGATYDDFRGTAAALLVSPRIETPLRLLTDDGQLHTLSAEGTWPRTSTGVGAASYAR